MKGYNHITDSERRRIERLLETGISIRKIARRLHRSAGTISEEIKRNKVKGKYITRKAEHKARVRRQRSKIQCMKAAMDENLKRYIIKNIKEEQSPAGISGRIKNIDRRVKYASPKAIYKFVKSVHGRQIEKYLYSKAVRKKSGPKRGRSNVTIDGRTMIDKRPKKVEKRMEFGHFEGDFIESGRDGKGSLLVLVERKSRYPFLAYTESKKTEHINKLVAETLRDVPVKSVTVDNDLSFQKHKELSSLIGTDIFFCHPQCSHEKGTVENRNKAIRRYIPKRSDLSQHVSKLKEIEDKLRNKFMECLNYKTPQEVFEVEMRKFFEDKKIPHCGTMNQVLKANESVRLER
jgi:IS30 family transposase